MTRRELRRRGALGKLVPVMEEILVRRADAVCELRLNRPAKRNAITFRMYAALDEALRAAQADGAVRVVMLSGEGAGFCAGNDLNDFLTGPAFSTAHPVMGFLHTLAAFGKPLVAAVHGQAVGIGVTMLLHCDLVLAARGAQLSMPFVSLGLVPEAASSLLLPRLAGTQRAAELLLLGSGLDAEAAQRLGLVNRVVDEAQLLSEARSVCRTLAQQPATALERTRRLLRGDPQDLHARIDEEARLFGEQLKSEEFRAAVRAVLSRGRSG